MKLRIAALVFMAAAAIAPQSTFAADEDDPLFVKGRSLFGRCRACHAFKPDTRSLSRGPNLWDVMGRKAGTAAGYTEYSRAMLDSKVIWSAETIDGYLADPRGYIPGNLMNFIGVPKSDERKALITYLVRVTGTAARPEQVTGLKLIRVEDRD